MKSARQDHERTKRCDERNDRADVDHTAGISASSGIHSAVAGRSHTLEEECPSNDKYDRNYPVARDRATARVALGHWDQQVLEELDVDVRQIHA